MIGPEWGEVEAHTGYVSRPLLGRRGTIELAISGPEQVDISIELATIYLRERGLDVLIDGTSAWKGTLDHRYEDGNWQRIDLEKIALQPGFNQMVLRTAEPVLSGEDAYNNGDERPISMILKSFRVSLIP